MKNYIKKFLSTVVLLSVMAFMAKAQTNVSGGIYANTVWITANSPYIITDTVVVFPGVTLTIQPGVTVKFANNQLLEIRQATLVASGSSSAPINFTSNSPAPSAGIYVGIYINGGTVPPSFNFCNFEYMGSGIYTNNNYTLSIKNATFINNTIGIKGISLHVALDSCTFRYNTTGMQVGGGKVTNCQISQNQTGMMQEGIPSVIQNCVIDSNQVGIYGNMGSVLNCVVNFNTTGIASAGSSIISNCQINSNQTGVSSQDADNIENSVIESNSIVGISTISQGNAIFNCQIRYNATGIIDAGPGSNLSHPFNSITKNVIENNGIGILLKTDGEQISCNIICNNTSYGLKYTATNNTSAANNYWCTADSASTQPLIYDGHTNVNCGLINFMPLVDSTCSNAAGILLYKTPSLSFKAFPNPVNTNLTIELPEDISKADIKIYNPLGDLVYSSKATVQSTGIDISALASGLYVIQIVSGNQSGRQQFIKQ